jgi:hypothetical protein
MFPIKSALKQGDAFSPLLLISFLKCTIGRVQVNQDGLKINGTYQLLVCVGNVNMLVHSVKTNRESLLVGSKEIRLEVKTDKTK